MPRAVAQADLWVLTLVGDRKTIEQGRAGFLSRKLQAPVAGIETCTWRQQYRCKQADIDVTDPQAVQGVEVYERHDFIVGSDGDLTLCREEAEDRGTLPETAQGKLAYDGRVDQ